MKIQTFAPLLVAFLTMHQAAHAQAPKLEQKTAFCASSVELLRKRDSNDLYLCETSVHTCGPYLKPSCLEDAKKGDWDVVSSSKQSLLKDYANTPCNCVGTQYVLTHKAPVEVQAPVAATPAASVPAPAVLPVAAPLAPATEPVAKAPAVSLASEVEALKQDNQQIKRMIEQLQRQFDELRRSLPAAK